MKIGINVSFLGKPMTGIGQVTTNFLRELASLSVKEGILNSPERVVYLYCQEAPVLDFELPKNFIVKVFLPWYRRNDVIRQWLWEKQLANEAAKDGCDVFFSLYQSATVFSSKGIRHVMLVHDIIPKLFPGYLKKWSHYWHYRAIMRGMQKAVALITPSETTKQDIIRELSISPQNIQVVPLGVNAQFFESFTDETLRKNLKRYQLDPGYLYHGGGLEVRKNTEANFFTIGHLARWAKYQGSMGGCGNITRNHILTALEAVGVPLDPPTPLGGKEQEKIFGLPINKLFSSRACWHRFADAEMVEDVTRRYCNTIGALVETVNDPEKLVVLEEQLKSVMGASRYTFGLTHLQDAVKRLITSQ